MLIKLQVHRTMRFVGARFGFRSEGRNMKGALSTYIPSIAKQSGVEGALCFGVGWEEF